LADAELDDLTRGLPRGGWALDTSTIDRVVEVVREIKPETVVEFGSGTSTIVLAALLRGLHSGRFPRLVSIEHDASWAQRTRDALAERGLAEVVEVVYAPLGPLDDNAPRCYVLDEAATAILRENAPELILVDGPSLHSGASRLGALDLVAPFLERDAIVLLDDALRDAELCVADVWQRRPDVTVHGLRMTPVGLLEATLHPRDADRGEALAVATNEGASIPDAGARNDPRGRRFRGSRRRRG
jgi:predicted O-methyltransferase YrrM